MRPSSLARATATVLGLLLAVTGLFPVATWLLDPAATGPAGAATRGLVDALAPSVTIGALAAVAAAMVGARTPVAARLGDAIGRVLPAPRGRSRIRWAAGCGTVAAVAAIAVHVLVFRGQPTLLDEMVQLADARVLDGALALPVDPAFRVLSNGRVVGAGTEIAGRADGWVSVYPTGHSALLALKLGIGGPAGHALVALVWGATVALATLLLFLVATPAAAAAGGALLAASPFGWLIAGGSLSHVSAAFGVSLALLAAVAATRRSGRSGLALAGAVGAGAGIAVNARPLTGVALGVVLPLLLWSVSWARGGGARSFVQRCAAASVGGLPALALLLGTSWHRFDSPFASGYGATFGPAHGLGWHVDPWGNSYDAAAAAGATAADLFTLGLAALESPVPLGVLIGVAAIVWAWSARDRASPERTRGGHAIGAREGDDLLLLTLWAGVALAANALYWHHGYHFGPRMLFETLPAWLGLATVLAGRLALGGVAVRGATTVVALLTILGAVVVGIPTRLETAAVPSSAIAATTPPPAPSTDAIVFVHGSAARRTSARLQALGIRADSIESALRRNDLCEVARWVDVRRGALPGAAPELDFALAPGTPAGLVTVETGPGVFARLTAGPGGAPFIAPECVASVIGPDRVGTIELDPLLWSVERSGALTGEAPLFVRDLGPLDNARLLDAFPGRPAWVLVPGPDGAPTYVEYVEAMERIWGAGAE